MNEYVAQAKEFLKNCNATMDIRFWDRRANKDWNETQLRNTYKVTIKTPKGSMTVMFWDSIANKQDGKRPTEYDILTCLQKYDVGTINEFMSEFGYEVHEWADVKRIEKIYNAVVEEYEDVCRCFTEEQIEAMRKIQ